MKYLKNFEEHHKYMSDEDIEKGYKNFKLSDIKFETRDMSYMYPKGTYEGKVVWSFLDDDEEYDEDNLPIGGFSETLEYFIYNKHLSKYKYVIDLWYPDSVYLKMCEIIEKELEQKYDIEFEKVRMLDSKLVDKK